MKKLMQARKFGSVVLITGLLAGFLDGLAAIIDYLIRGRTHPENIFKYIASGVFGKKAFTNGPIMVCWGVLFHFLIAMLFTLFYFLIYKRIKGLGNQLILAAVLYGSLVWVIMNLVVVPLSFNTPVTLSFQKIIISLLILICCIGLPITFMARKYYLYQK